MFQLGDYAIHVHVIVTIVFAISYILRLIEHMYPRSFSLGLVLLIALELASICHRALHLSTGIFIVRVSRLSLKDWLWVSGGCE